MLGLIPALQKCCKIYCRVSSGQTLYFSKACWIEREKYQIFWLQQKTRNFIWVSLGQSLSQPELGTPPPHHHLPCSQSWGQTSWPQPSLFKKKNTDTSCNLCYENLICDLICCDTMKNLSVAITVTRGTAALPAFQERLLVVASERVVSCWARTFGLLRCQTWGIIYRQLSV